MANITDKRIRRSYWVPDILTLMKDMQKFELPHRLELHILNAGTRLQEYYLEDKETGDKAYRGAWVVWTENSRRTLSLSIEYNDIHRQRADQYAGIEVCKK